MKFGISFVPYTELKTQSVSGNPGYIANRPLLVAMGEDSETGIKNVARNGYFAVSSDESGKCLAPGTLSSQALKIDFQDDILLSCKT